MCAVLAAWLWGGAGIANSIRESLWLDELHSVWAANGALDEVHARAAMGNQLSPYFYLLWLLGETIGTAEIVWRSPSVCAWLATIALTAWSLASYAGSRRDSMILAGLALIVCDRAQIFYATEARPYALLGLVNLVSWLVLQHWSEACYSQKGASASRLPVLGFVAWCLLNSASFWLQPTALVFIAAQFVYLIGLALCSLRNPECLLKNVDQQVKYARHPMHSVALKILGLVLIAGLLLAVTTWPAHSMLRPVWERRYLWTGFAAGHNFSDILNLLPLTAFLTPMLVGCLISVARSVIHSRRAMQLRSPIAHDAGQSAERAAFEASSLPFSFSFCSNRPWWLWLCAWLLPCCVVVALTASGIAPLMHRRYVFAASVPFVIWIALSWMALRNRPIQWCALGVMLFALLYQQGSLEAWRHGIWPAAVRGEDWRGAVGLINSQAVSGAPRIVLCASNLIEGTERIPDDDAVRHYLSLPLRSIYRIEPPARVVPLANDARTWADALLEARRTAQPLPDARLDVDTWLVVRSSASGLERRLRASGLAGERRFDFGGVQVVGKVQLAATR